MSITANSTGPRSRTRAALICVCLAALTFAVFGQTLRHEFVNFDDDEYVYNNPVVSQGLTHQGFVWAFSYHANNWHPLTWFSHMMDCQLYGLRPAGHHITNVLLHAATVVILFLILNQMTGALWRSAVVAAVFAIHPLRAESVAWVAERKDVLSGLFFVLTIWAYARYARQSGGLFYALSALFFLLGLMAKPMLVTLPLVLLLLDYWPLQRKESVKKLILEKVPLLILSIAVSAVTMLAQHGTVESTRYYPLLLRLENALVSCAIYLGQLVWPANLSPFYPFPHSGLSRWLVALAAVVGAGFSWVVWRQRRAQPWLLVGWFWYLAMLLPVIGIIQVGDQAHADRYTYLPHIGIYLAICWLIAEQKINRPILATFAALAIIALSVVAAKQTSYWRNSQTLWTHALGCDENNYVAHLNLGTIYLENGKADDAIREFQRSLELSPQDAEPHYDLAAALDKKGRLDEAISEYEQTLKIQPGHVKAHYHLGLALQQMGRLDEAIPHFENVARLDFGNVNAHIILGNALMRSQQFDQAISEYQRALQISPGYGMVHNNLGNAFLKKGNVKEAIGQYEQAVQIGPPDSGVENNLAWLLATCADPSLRNGPKALELAQKANTQTGGENPLILHTLAAAFAETGRFPDAVETANRAMRLADAQSKPGLVERLRNEISLYQAGTPFHAGETPH